MKKKRVKSETVTMAIWYEPHLNFLLPFYQRVSYAKDINLNNFVYLCAWSKVVWEDMSCKFLLVVRDECNLNE